VMGAEGMTLIESVKEAGDAGAVFFMKSVREVILST
jgi:hypothetical protein